MRYSIPTLLALYQDANIYCNWTNAAKDCKILHPQKVKRPARLENTTKTSKKRKSTPQPSSRPIKTSYSKAEARQQPHHVNSTSSFGGSNIDNPGFARFLREHSSPRHQRVTAGGRIVPMEPNDTIAHPGEVPMVGGFAHPPQMADVMQFISQMRHTSMQRQTEETLNEMTTQLSAFQPNHDSPQILQHGQGTPYSLESASMNHEAIPSAGPMINFISGQAPFEMASNGQLYMGWGPMPNFSQSIPNRTVQSIHMQMPFQPLGRFPPDATPSAQNELYSPVSQSAASMGAFIADGYTGGLDSSMDYPSIIATLQQSISGSPFSFWNWMSLVTNMVEISMGDMERLVQAYDILTVHRANIQQMIINTSVNIAWTQVTHSFQRDYRVMYINMRDMTDRALQMLEVLIGDLSDSTASKFPTAQSFAQISCDGGKFKRGDRDEQQEKAIGQHSARGISTTRSSSSNSTSNASGLIGEMVQSGVRQSRKTEPSTVRLTPRLSRSNQFDGACSDMGTRHAEDDELWPNMNAQSDGKIQHDTMTSVPECLLSSRDNDRDKMEFPAHADRGILGTDPLFAAAGSCDNSQKKAGYEHSIDRDLQVGSPLSNTNIESLLTKDVQSPVKEYDSRGDRLRSLSDSGPEVDTCSVLLDYGQSIFSELNRSKQSLASLYDPGEYDTEIETVGGSLEESEIGIDQRDTLIYTIQLEYETDTSVGSVSSDDWSICVNPTMYSSRAHKPEPTSDNTTVSRSSICSHQLNPHELLPASTFDNLKNSDPIMSSSRTGNESCKAFNNKATKELTKKCMSCGLRKVSGEFEVHGEFSRGNLQLDWAAQGHTPTAQQGLPELIRRQIFTGLQNQVHDILVRGDGGWRRSEQRKIQNQEVAKKYRTEHHRLQPSHQTRFTIETSTQKAFGEFARGQVPNAIQSLRNYSSDDENNSYEQTSM